MSLTFTREDIKRKSMVPSSNGDYNSVIDKLISEMRPAIEYTIDPLYLNDTENGDLQALLTLGAMELIAAEFLAQRAREPGFGEEFQIGQLRVGQFWERGKQLAIQGELRLAPYLRKPETSADTDPVMASVPSERLFTKDSMRRW